MAAVGVWEDQSQNEYVIFVLDILGEGASYAVSLALTMEGSHSLGSIPTPKIFYEGDKYMVSFTHPSNGALYVFDQTKGDTDLNNIRMLKVELPSTYSSDEYRLGYVDDGYLGIISKKTATWWAASIDMSSGQPVWSRTKTAQPSLSHCASCAIRGYDDFFAITGKTSSSYDVLLISASSTSGSDTMLQIDFNGGDFALYNWVADSIYATTTSSGGYKVGVFYIHETVLNIYAKAFLEFDSSFNLVEVRDFGTTGYDSTNILSSKVQFDPDGQIAYYFVQHDGMFVTSYLDSDGYKKAYLSEFAPKIDPADTIDVNGITVL